MERPVKRAPQFFFRFFAESFVVLLARSAEDGRGAHVDGWSLWYSRIGREARRHGRDPSGAASD